MLPKVEALKLLGAGASGLDLTCNVREQAVIGGAELVDQLGTAALPGEPLTTDPGK